MKHFTFFNIYFLIAVAVIAVIAIIVAILIILRKVAEKRAVDQKPDDTVVPDIAPDHEESKFSETDWDYNRLRQHDEAVIKVEDVTMVFRLASDNVSGLKDYLIQLLRRSITYRNLYALYHISFNIYEGEIMGIIGTNGSGKSTLLKVISGALLPTSGRVEVDRKKVQLLTLGTGFDMELTGRENVYLNGSIIGYSKEFLDKHYDSIVEFAELKDFMDQKVKNYSSGMVSRLGFAIATAGDAAEILILDEVLAVGDEFFRKKSLERIGEMIRGGSTVLIVSHSMDTISKYCSRCMWLDQGRIKMIGKPKEVCDAYKKMREGT